VYVDEKSYTLEGSIDNLSIIPKHSVVRTLLLLELILYADVSAFQGFPGIGTAVIPIIWSWVTSLVSLKFWCAGPGSLSAPFAVESVPAPNKKNLFVQLLSSISFSMLPNTSSELSRRWRFLGSSRASLVVASGDEIRGKHCWRETSSASYLVAYDLLYPPWKLLASR